MLKFTRDSYVDVDLYERRLKRTGYIVIDSVRLRQLRDYNNNIQTTLYGLLGDVISANSGNKYPSISKNNIYHYLTEMEGVPYRRIGTTPSGDISLDVNSYLKPLYEDGYAEEFLKLYIEAVGVKAKNNIIAGILTRSYEPIDDNSEHKHLKKCRFNVNQKDNLRYFYKDNAIVSISEIYNEAIVAPPGYVLVTGDFAQADFRIAYNLLLRDETNAEIMDNIEDKYEGIARVLAKTFDEPFDLDKFKATRKLFKANILGPMYGKCNANSKKSQAFIHKMNAFLDLCPRYQAFKQSLLNRIEMGLPLVIDSYFGYSTTIPVGIGKKGEKDTLNKALNTPIQTGTSELMILIVNSILDKFYALDYTEEDVDIYYTRHDEPLFILKEHAMKDAWVFKNASRIIIDSWTPLDIEFTFHKRYGVDCSEYNDMYKRSIIQNNNKIEVIEPDKEFTPYSAIKQTQKLAFHIEKVDTKSVLAIYDATAKRVQYRLYNTTNEFEVFEQAKQEVLNSCTDLFRRECNGALVRNKFLAQDIFYGGILYKFSKVENSEELAIANILCQNMSTRLAKRDGLQYTPNIKLGEFVDIIKGVAEWDER